MARRSAPGDQRAPDTFGTLLKQLRQRAGLTQTELAIAVGCSIGQVCRLEQNQRRPDIESLLALYVPALKLEGDAATVARLLEFASLGRGEAAARALPVEASPPVSFARLPVVSTPLIGREAALEALMAQVVGGARLVTVTGGPGMGKTRLALEVAHQAIDAFEHGALFVELAPLDGAGQVIGAIAAALGVREGGGQPLTTRVATFLADKHLLMVLDNFEQVMEAASDVATLLAAAPRLRLLVTSRAVLRLRGEHEFSVEPLPYPQIERVDLHVPSAMGARLPVTSTAPVTAEALAAWAAFPAMALFQARAQAVKANFALTPSNVHAVAEICARLEGLPLAIELAATQVRRFSPETLLERLESRLGLLAQRTGSQPTRQQTLRGAIAWSYNLLEQHDQRLFARLAIFKGGCTLEAAEAITGDQAREATAPASFFANFRMPLNHLEALASLVDQSLLRQTEGPEGEPRFWMLETIREYALERLDERQESDWLALRHLRYFQTLAQAGEKGLRGDEQPRWLGCLETEHENFRSALGWGLRAEASAEAAEAAITLATALGRFWQLHGHLTEGREWLTAAGTRSQRPEMKLSDEVRAKLWYQAGRLANTQDDFELAKIFYQQSLKIWEALGDQHGMALIKHNLGIVAYGQGDFAEATRLTAESLMLRRQFDEPLSVANSLNSLGVLSCEQGDCEIARTYLEESLAIRRAANDSWGIAQSLQNLGVTYHTTDRPRARQLYEASLAMQRELGIKLGIADSLNTLAALAVDEGDVAKAKPLIHESLCLAIELGDLAGTADCLDHLTVTVMAEGQPVMAVWLSSYGQALRERIGAGRGPVAMESVQGRMAALGATLGAEAFESAVAAGRALTAEQALRLALEASR